MLHSPMLSKAFLPVALVWAAAQWVHAQQVVVRPEPAPGAIDNPLKGWCPYPNAVKISQPYSMVFQYISWRELEPQPGRYQFDAWEKSWNEGAAQGKHVIFRVYVDYPKKPSGLPDWLREAGVNETAYTDHGGGKSPDYNDPRVIAAMERLIAALGERYNHNPRVAFVQLGLLGFWGEWHTYPRSELFASAETQRRIIDAYHKAFPDKSLMVRYARDYAGQQDWIGFHDDQFPQDTDNGHDWSFLAGIRRAKRSENWQHAVIGGEMFPGQADRFLGADFGTTMEMIKRAHFTWVGPYCPALANSGDKQFAERSAQLVRAMGYNFQITELTHPAQVKSKQSIHISFQGTNLGVAPFYYPWTVEWVLLDAAGKQVHLQKTAWDIRRWQPGNFAEEVDIEIDLPPGIYRLGLGIRDPWRDRPAIRFANDLPVSDGWTMLSEIRVPDTTRIIDTIALKSKCRGDPSALT